MKLLFLAVALVVRGGDLYDASVASSLAAQAMDIASTRGLIEENPVLGRGQFGMRQATIGMSLTAVGLLVQIPIIRRWPRTRRYFAAVNLGHMAVNVTAAAHNWALK